MDNTTASSLRPHPPFPPNMRMATVEDLPRLSLVGAAGFRDSPFYYFQRPAHADFPQDTVDDYRCQCIKSMMDASEILVVVSAEYRDDEIEFVHEELKNTYQQNQPKVSKASGQQVIVGYVSCVFANPTQRNGRFATEGAPPSWRLVCSVGVGC